MLWEVMFEMLGELFAVLGEILSTFWKIGGSISAHLKKKKEDKLKNGPPDPAAAKSQAQLVLIFTILGFIIAVSMLFPKVRHFVFGPGGITGKSNAMVEETPRNFFPMGQYTTPQFYKKKKFIIDEDGIKRAVYYYLYEPTVAKGQKLPLVIVLHGKDGTSPAATFLRSGALQKQFPSFLLIPMSKQGKIWDAPAKYTGQEFPKAELQKQPPAELRALKDVLTLMSKTVKEDAVDQNRMYLVGCDEGAAGVYGAAANYPGLFAGGVAIAGKWSFTDRRELAQTPLLILHGSADKIIPAQFASNMAQVINASRGQAAYHEFPGVGHDCDSPYFYAQAVWQWLFAQARVEDIAPAPVAAPVAATVKAP